MNTRPASQPRNNSGARNPAWAVVLGLLLLSLWGCFAVHRQEPNGDLVDEKVTAARVEQALTNNAPYRFPQVRVATSNGVVILTGFVEQPVQKEQAARLAGSVKRGLKLENEIQIRP